MNGSAILMTNAAGGIGGQTGRRVAEMLLAGGDNPHAVEHLSQLWSSFRTFGQRPDAPPCAVTGAIETLGGAKPKTFEAFVREEQRALTARRKS